MPARRTSRFECSGNHDASRRAIDCERSPLTRPMLYWSHPEQALIDLLPTASAPEGHVSAVEAH